MDKGKVLEFGNPGLKNLGNAFSQISPAASSPEVREIDGLLKEYINGMRGDEELRGKILETISSSLLHDINAVPVADFMAGLAGTNVLDLKMADIVVRNAIAKVNQAINDVDQKKRELDDTLYLRAKLLRMVSSVGADLSQEDILERIEDLFAILNWTGAHHLDRQNCVFAIGRLGEKIYDKKVRAGIVERLAPFREDNVEGVRTEVVRSVESIIYANLTRHLRSVEPKKKDPKIDK